MNIYYFTKYRLDSSDKNPWTIEVAAINSDKAREIVLRKHPNLPFADIRKARGMRSTEEGIRYDNFSEDTILKRIYSVRVIDKDTGISKLLPGMYVDIKDAINKSKDVNGTVEAHNVQSNKLIFTVQFKTAQ